MLRDHFADILGEVADQPLSVFNKSVHVQGTIRAKYIC